MTDTPVAEAQQLRSVRAQRLRSVRQRSGLSQEELATASGVSLRTIRTIEQAAEENVRMETLHKLAKACRVPTSTLSGEQGDPETAHAGSVEAWAAVRRALVGQGLAPMDEPATIEDVTSSLAYTHRVFRAGRFDDIAPGLPGLIRDAVSLDERDGRGLLCEVYCLTGWLLVHTHQYSTAEMALWLARDQAADRADLAKVEHVRSWMLIRSGDLEACHRDSARWADELEPRISRASDGRLGSWAWVLLRVAMTAGRNNEPGASKEALRLAGAAAAAIGREIFADGDPRRPIGPGVVAAKTAELAMIQDNPDLVLKLAATIPPDVAAVNNPNWNRHRLDVAWAYAHLGRYDQAVSVFQHLHATAAPWLVEQRYARDILEFIFGRRRTLTAEMRAIADACRLPY